MAKKFNMVAAKEFLLKHGEKVVLGACAFIAVSFGIMGLLRASNAGRAEGTPLSSETWQEAFKKTKAKIEQKRDGLQPEPMTDEMLATLQPKKYEWPKADTDYRPVPYVSLADNANANKRLNPIPLAANSDAKTMLLEYMQGGIFVYKPNPDKSVDGLGGVGEAGERPMPPMQPMPKGQPGVPANLPTYALDVRPTRAVIGTMVFPLKKLVADYVKSLRLDSQNDLFTNRDDLPRFVGYDIRRYEILPNNEYANREGELIIGIDPKSKQTKVSPALKKMLREAVYDDQLPVNLEPYLFAGISMPMPKWANRHYAKPNLDGFEFAGFDEEPRDDKKRPGGGKIVGGVKEGGGVVVPGKKVRPEPPMPMDPMGGGVKPVATDRKIVPIPYKDLLKADPHLANRLFNKDFEKDFNYFHALGQKAPLVPIENKGGVNPMPQMPAMPPQVGGRPGAGANNEGRFFAAWDVPIVGEELPGGPEGGGVIRPERPIGNPEQPMGGIGGAEVKNWDRDALVRFIDVDVEPGKTYQYAIQIRLANPNYKKTNFVAFAALASIPELPLPKEKSWVFTDTITIPREYYIYAVDQLNLDDWAGDKINKKEHFIIGPKDHANLTTIQVHQWVKYKDDRAAGVTHPIADWAVAERLIVRRGDEIGLGAEVQLPVWHRSKDSFELPKEIKDAKKKEKQGLKLDLRPFAMEKDGKESAQQPPVLVDFSGGKRFKTTGTGIEEEAPVDVLIIDYTGKLILRNSRIDSDARFPNAVERQDRVAGARRRVSDLSGGTEKGPGGIVRPMVPGAMP